LVGVVVVVGDGWPWWVGGVGGGQVEGLVGQWVGVRACAQGGGGQGVTQNKHTRFCFLRSEQGHIKYSIFV
jgi:hypothetical protein